MKIKAALLDYQKHIFEFDDQTDDINGLIEVIERVRESSNAEFTKLMSNEDKDLVAEEDN